MSSPAFLKLLSFLWCFFVLILLVYSWYTHGVVEWFETQIPGLCLFCYWTIISNDMFHSTSLQSNHTIFDTNLILVVIRHLVVQWMCWLCIGFWQSQNLYTWLYCVLYPDSEMQGWIIFLTGTNLVCIKSIVTSSNIQPDNKTTKQEELNYWRSKVFTRIIASACSSKVSLFVHLICPSWHGASP